MKLTYAVERLYQTGWSPATVAELERLDDGRGYPSILGIQREFSDAGLELAIRHNLIFKCYRATWAPIGQRFEEDHAPDERHGTVVGACQREAAVYALAQFREAQAERQLAAV